VGLLAGVTGVIDREYALGAILGERFLLYRVKGAPARVLARRAILQRSSLEEQQRKKPAGDRWPPISRRSCR
jgi:hypothetical protein